VTFALLWLCDFDFGFLLLWLCLLLQLLLSHCFIVDIVASFGFSLCICVMHCQFWSDVYFPHFNNSPCDPLHRRYDPVEHSFSKRGW
jgi:hypothetical protein